MRARRVRLSELKREIPSASKKALTASLRSLEAGRVVLRRDLSSSVLHVEYELADATRESLAALLDHLAEWGKLYDTQEQSATSHPEIESHKLIAAPEKRSRSDGL
jgi:DNA-binding HxlR family transcriptional regulator